MAAEQNNDILCQFALTAYVSLWAFLGYKYAE